MTDSRSIRHQTLLRAAVMAAVVLIGVSAMAVHYYRRHIQDIDAQKQAQGTLLLDIAENGLRAHLREALYHPEHLDDWFTGLVVAAHLGGIQFKDGTGGIILAVGPYYEDAASKPVIDYVEMGRTLPVLEGLAPRGWRRGGRERGLRHGVSGGMGWQQLPEGPYTFTLAFDPASWQHAAHVLRMRTLFGAALFFACGLLLIAMYVYREQQFRLGVALDAAEARGARQAMLAQLGAGLAHETKNPLGLIRGFAQRIRDRADVGDVVRDKALQIIDETDRVVGQIDGFLSLAKPMDPRTEVVPLESLFESLHRLLQDEAGEARIALTFNANDMAILADVDLLRKALLNILLNAFKACAPGDTVLMAAERTDASVACIRIQDTGRGIAPEDLCEVTKPYFTRFEEGVGLGLALTEEIAHVHGWRLELASTLGEGTEARIENIHLSREST